MKLLFALLGLIVLVQDNVEGATTTKRPVHEKFELDNVVFHYDPRTHILLVLNHGKCYLNLLPQTDLDRIHTDLGLLHVETRVLSTLNTAYFTSVPSAILHPNLIRGCTGTSNAFYLVH